MSNKGGIMKRSAIISMIAVFLTTNYAYATIPIEELSQKIETLQYQKLTQEEVENLFISIISSIDWKNKEQTLIFLESLPQLLEAQPLQDGCGFIFALYILLRIFFTALVFLEPLVGVPVYFFIGFPTLFILGLQLVICGGGY